MELDFSTSGKVLVTMINYINEMLDEAPDGFTGTSPTPAAKHLFDTSENAAQLSEKDAAVFHHIVARALFLAKRARPDI